MSNPTLSISMSLLANRHVIRGSTVPMDGKERKKTKRKEVLEKKKAVDQIIRAALAVKDHLTYYPPFCEFSRNDLSVYLESGTGEQLSSPMKQYIQTLLKVNMEGPYGLEWAQEEKVKRREMVATEAHYIFLRESPISSETPGLEGKPTSVKWAGGGNKVVGFLHYRFVVEEDVPVLYVYELQLESSVQGKGLGKFLMQLIELIAHKNNMGAVMLTVQKSNIVALNFYTKKLRYVISSISPSRVDPLMGVEKNYEILCKTFDEESKVKLEF